MKRDAQLLVVGGGVIGLSVAFELLRRGRPVCVLERDRPGSGATDAAGGMLAPISESEVERPEQIRFGLDSLRRFPEFVRRVERVAGTSCGYRSEGTLWVSCTRDDQGDLDHLAVTLEEKRLPFRRLTRTELLELEPHLSPRVLSGLLVHGDLQADPRALSHALGRAIVELGGSLRTGVTVDRLEASGGRLRAVRGRDRQGAPVQLDGSTAIVCAGAWTAELDWPLPPIGLRPLKGQLVRLHGPRLLRHVVRFPRGYLVPREDGELLVGATMEELGFDQTPTAGAVLDLLRHAWQVLPGLYELELTEVSVGLRSAVDDQLPVIGRTEIDGLYLATGHYRNGILLAPATAHYLAELVTSGQLPAELEPFDPARLWAHSPARSI